MGEMVGIPEKTAYKPLNAPEPLVVKENVSGLPIKIGKGNLAVAAVEDRWRIDDEWWRQDPVSRMYYAIVLGNGWRMVIFKDLITGVWYHQTIGITHQ